MTMTFSADVLERVCEHLSLAADELVIESTTDTVDGVTGRWHGFATVLSHLSRVEKQQVLQRSRPFTPLTVDGVQLTLFTDVQVLKGMTRVTAAIVDDGSTRHVVMGY